MSGASASSTSSPLDALANGLDKFAWAESLTDALLQPGRTHAKFNLQYLHRTLGTPRQSGSLVDMAFSHMSERLLPIARCLSVSNRGPLMLRLRCHR
jgi:hypothetical protein